MKINVMPEIGDDVVLMLHQSHEIGAVVKANNSTPCSLCRASMELNDGIIHRDHFHVSDTGACARKTFYLMRDGYKKSATKAQFLNDGHLHEASMISNLMAGLPDGWKIKPMENKSEMRLDILGFTLIGHIDALLYEPSYAANGQGRAYIVECKCVKEYTWKKVKEGEISNEWYGQCQFYPLMYDKEGMDTTYLIVKHRMTSDTLPPIRIKRYNKWIVDRLNVLKDVHTRLVEGLDEPDREHKTSRDSECKFCPFGNEIGDKSCWKMKES